jgi:hypothetical protein
MEDEIKEVKNGWQVQPDGRVFLYEEGVFKGWVKPMEAFTLPEKGKGETVVKTVSLDELLKK